MLEGMTLKGRAVGLYGSLNNFATSVGWSYSKAYRVLNGRQKNLSVAELRTILDALHVKDADFLPVFKFLTDCPQTGHTKT